MNPTDEIPQALFDSLTEAEVRCLIEDMGDLTGALPFELALTEG